MLRRAFAHGIRDGYLPATGAAQIDEHNEPHELGRIAWRLACLDTSEGQGPDEFERYLPGSTGANQIAIHLGSRVLMPTLWRAPVVHLACLSGVIARVIEMTLGTGSAANPAVKQSIGVARKISNAYEALCHSPLDSGGRPPKPLDCSKGHEYARLIDTYGPALVLPFLEEAGSDILTLAMLVGVHVLHWGHLDPVKMCTWIYPWMWRLGVPKERAKAVRDPAMIGAWHCVEKAVEACGGGEHHLSREMQVRDVKRCRQAPH